MNQALEDDELELARQERIAAGKPFEFDFNSQMGRVHVKATIVPGDAAEIVSVDFRGQEPPWLEDIEDDVDEEAQRVAEEKFGAEIQQAQDIMREVERSGGAFGERLGAALEPGPKKGEEEEGEEGEGEEGGEEGEEGEGEEGEWGPESEEEARFEDVFGSRRRKGGKKIMEMDGIGAATAAVAPGITAAAGPAAATATTTTPSAPVKIDAATAASFKKSFDMIRTFVNGMRKTGVRDPNVIKKSLIGLIGPEAVNAIDLTKIR